MGPIAQVHRNVEGVIAHLLLQVEQVTVRFGGLVALDKVDLHVWWILAPSGTDPLGLAGSSVHGSEVE